MKEQTSKEQALINELIRLLCKGGCEAFVGNFQRDVAPKETWSDQEITEAIHYVRYMNEYFGKQEAVTVITSLVSRYHIVLSDLTIPDHPEQKVGLES